jgi:hypothetical protein
MQGNFLMVKTSGAHFPVAQLPPGHQMRRMASLYNEVTADDHACASDNMAAAGCQHLDRQGCDVGSVQKASASGGCMSLGDVAPVLFKEDTLKTLQREAAHLGSKPSPSEPATSQCSGRVKSSGFASGSMDRGAERNLAPFNAPQDGNHADGEPSWFMDKLMKQPTLSMMCSEVPGSWDPLMAFPVEIAKEGSGEHNAYRESSLSLQPHGAVRTGTSAGVSTPALRIEVLNTGLSKDVAVPGNDSKHTSCASRSGKKQAAMLRGSLRSTNSTPSNSSGKVCIHLHTFYCCPPYCLLL